MSQDPSVPSPSAVERGAIIVPALHSFWYLSVFSLACCPESSLCLAYFGVEHAFAPPPLPVFLPFHVGALPRSSVAGSRPFLAAASVRSRSAAERDVRRSCLGTMAPSLREYGRTPTVCCTRVFAIPLLDAACCRGRPGGRRLLVRLIARRPRCCSFSHSHSSCRHIRRPHLFPFPPLPSRHHFSGRSEAVVHPTPIRFLRGLRFAAFSRMPPSLVGWSAPPPVPRRSAANSLLSRHLCSNRHFCARRGFDLHKA